MSADSLESVRLAATLPCGFLGGRARAATVAAGSGGVVNGRALLPLMTRIVLPDTAAPLPQGVCAPALFMKMSLLIRRAPIVTTCARVPLGDV